MFQREEESFAFLGTFDRCHKTTQHNDRHRANFRYFLCNWTPKYTKRSLYTTEKVLMGYFLSIYTKFCDILDHYTM